MSGAKHRRKGDRVEREIVATLKEASLFAERVPLSGAQGGSYSGDIRVHDAFGRDYKIEVKARKDGGGFTQLERWLGDNDALVLKRNHAEPMIVLNWSSWVKLLKGAT